MAKKQALLKELVRLGEETYANIPPVNALPRGKQAVAKSFVVENETMRQMAMQMELTADVVISMIRGEKWQGIQMTPISAALLAPAFEESQQFRISEALEISQRLFWEKQHFYLDEMAGSQANRIPNALMRETSEAVEERALEFLRQRLQNGPGSSAIWVDYAAGPASFVNGALQRLQEEGLDVSQVNVVLVEPATHFREFAQQQPVLRMLGEMGRLHILDGILEDAETYATVEGILKQSENGGADIVTQAFGASYVADHLRPAMWRRMLGSARPDALKMVVATTNKYSPPRMIVHRLKDEISSSARVRSKDGFRLQTIGAIVQGTRAWIDAFARPVSIDPQDNTQPALAVLIRYGQGVKQHCPIRQAGEAFADEIRDATGTDGIYAVPVLGGQAILIVVAPRTN